jgi:hypothetical protein
MTEFAEFKTYATRKIERIAFHRRHCERSEAIQRRRTEGWIASLRSQ